MDVKITQNYIRIEYNFIDEHPFIRFSRTTAILSDVYPTIALILGLISSTLVTTNPKIFVPIIIALVLFVIYFPYTEYMFPKKTLPKIRQAVKDNYVLKINSMEIIYNPKTASVILDEDKKMYTILIRDFIVVSKEIEEISWS